MAFSDEILRGSSERTVFVRITPGRDITASLSFDSAVSGGNKYAYPKGLLPDFDRMTRNGSDLTKSAAITDTLDHWYEDGDYIKVNLASAPHTSTNIIILFYHLFYTDGVGERVRREPDIDAGSVPFRYWEPRIVKSPSYKTAITNITKGILSLTSSSLELSDTDNAVKSFITDNDSFYNKNVRAWIRVNGAWSVFFNGTVVRISMVNNKIIFGLLTGLEKLSAPFFMGDTKEESYHLSTSGYTQVAPDNLGAPKPYVVGRSRTRFLGGNAVSINSGGIGGFIEPLYEINPSASLQAVCTDFDNTMSPSARNREWSLARTSPSGFKVLNFGTISSIIVDNVGTPGPTIYYKNEQCNPLVITTSGHNLEIGDSFTAVKGGTTYYCLVVFVSSTTITCWISLSTGQGYTITAGTTDNFSTATLSTTAVPAISIILPSGETILPLYSRDFSVSISNTSYGNKTMSVTFVNGFESKHYFTSGTVTYLEPSTTTVGYRVTEDTATINRSLHGTVIQSMLESLGINVKASFITAANSDLAASCSFSMPYFGEDDYRPGIEYIQKIVQSTLGYLSLQPQTGNTDDSILYGILSTPTGGVDRTVDHIKRQSLQIDIEYRDIITQLILKNNHDSPIYPTVDMASTSTVENLQAKYLHEITSSHTIDHVLQDISLREDAIIDFRSSRDISYSYVVAAADLDTILVDGINLIHDDLQGGLTSVETTVLSTTKSPNSVKIVSSDMGNL